MIADAFGHMARFSLVSHLDCIERELLNAFEWLRTSTLGHQRFAACVGKEYLNQSTNIFFSWLLLFLVLQQLAENAPTLLFARIKDFFDLIWGPLWDAKDKIRFAASGALSSCLAVLVHRTYHLGNFFSCYDS